MCDRKRKRRKPPLAAAELRILIAGILWILPITFSTAQTTENEESVTTNAEQAEESPWKFGGFFRQGFHSVGNEKGNSKTILTSFSALRLETVFEKGQFKSEVSGTGQTFFGNRSGSPEFQALWAGQPRNRLLAAETTATENDAILKGSLHRGNVQAEFGSWNLRVGRQAIGWGQGRFLNPLDLITPIDPFILDFEDVPGADAVNLTWYLNDTDFLQAVAVPYRRSDNRNYRELNSEDVNGLLRGKFTFAATDITILGGWHFHSGVFGADSSSNFFGGNLRFAWLGRAEKEETIVTTGTIRPAEIRHQALAGYSYAFGNFRLGSEFFWNSVSGQEEDRSLALQERLISTGLAAPLAGDQSFFLVNGRIITERPIFQELSLSYDFATVLSAGVFLLWDIEGGAAFLLPQLTWNFSDEGVFNLACHFAVSDRSRSEFSRLPVTAYAWARVHF